MPDSHESTQAAARSEAHRGLQHLARRWIAADLPPRPHVDGGYSSTGNEFLHAAEAAWWAAHKERHG